MKKPELLAPAGNLEKLKTAISFGADAVKANEKEEIVYADIDTTQVLKYRDERPYIKLRRPQLYSEICDSSIYKAF